MPDQALREVTVHHPGGIATGITVIDGAFSDDLAERVYLFARDGIEELGGEGRTVGGLMPDVKRTRDMAMCQMDEWTGNFSIDALSEVGFDPRELDAEIAAALDVALHHFWQAYPEMATFPLNDSGYLLQRYAKGEGYYKCHIDSTPSAHPDRILSVVVYLNDVDEGGETYFDRHGFGVQPRRGRVCIFPAIWTHPHGSLVPLSDDKYIISTFMSSTN